MVGELGWRSGHRHGDRRLLSLRCHLDNPCARPLPSPASDRLGTRRLRNAASARVALWRAGPRRRIAEGSILAPCRAAARVRVRDDGWHGRCRAPVRSTAASPAAPSSSPAPAWMIAPPGGQADLRHPHHRRVRGRSDPPAHPRRPGGRPRQGQARAASTRLSARRPSLKAATALDRPGSTARVHKKP